MIRQAVTVIHFLAEFAIYDAARFWFGCESFYTRIGNVRRATERFMPHGDDDDDRSRQSILKALELALTLYPRRVWCLQRSSAAARILRRSGYPAQLVIGYSPDPFMSHAWVEIGTSIFEGPTSYSERLTILQRLG
jgi:hypothetical protein